MSSSLARHRTTLSNKDQHLSNPNRAALWKSWVLALLWTLVIAAESTDTFSSSNTSRFIYPFLNWLFGPLDFVKYQFWNGVARKCGHVIGYAILCWLFFRAFRATWPYFKTWSVRWALPAWIATAVIASLDEWHQSYIPSRTGTFHDVILDSSAGLAVLGALFYWNRRRTTPTATRS